MTEELSNNETAAVIRKVRSLLRVKEGNANEHEATTAAMLASRLIAQHNLTQHDIYNVPDKRVKDSVLSSKHKERWVIFVWGAVARLNFCKYYYTDGDARGIVHTLIGTVANVTASQVMAEYLVEAIWRLSIEAPIKGTQRNSFKLGGAHRLHARLSELKEQRAKGEETPADVTAAGGTKLPALANLYDVHKQENEAFFASLGLGKLGKGWRGGKVSNYGAYSQGVKAADSINLNLQVEEVNPVGLLK